jgi:hypothetical protein
MRFSPMWIRPFKKVPVVTTTAPARQVRPDFDDTIAADEYRLVFERSLTVHRDHGRSDERDG